MRIAIIVDNPLRDLNADTLLAYVLAKRGFSVALVPMYYQELYLRFWRPNLVIVNYARCGNADKIKLYHDARIKVAVLDTEGGVLRDVERDLVGLVKKSGVFDLLDYYFLWGRRQFDAFKSLRCGRPEFFLTGTPRYDFISPRWGRVIKRSKLTEGPYILFLTNFACNNPQFSHRDKEKELLLRDTIDTSHQVDAMLIGLDLALKGTIQIIKEVAADYPHEKFVIRPHPFESQDAYLRELNGLKNVQVIKEGNVLDWIKYSKFVIQFNSSTGIEAGFYGKKSISLEMFQDPELAVPAVTQCSYSVAGQEELKRVFKSLVSGVVPEDVERKFAKASSNLKQVEHEWFYQVDGNASERIADVIEMISKRDSDLDSGSHFGVLNPVLLRQTFRYLAKKIYQVLVRPERLKRIRAKYFSMQEIKSIIDDIKDKDEFVLIDRFGVFGKILSNVDSAVSISIQ